MNTTVNSRQRRQRGAATLVVVMVLFLVVAMLAAYANRSILFEQRISSSYYRSSISQEMAEGAIDWTVAMLNGKAINARCEPVAIGGTRFVDRYFKINTDTRDITADNTRQSIVADCTRSGQAWVCRCPTIGNRAVPPPSSTDDLVPSFGIGIERPTDRSGTVLITASGCTSSVVDDCGNASADSKKYQGFSRQQTLLALVSAVRSPPAAPLIVKGMLVSADGGLGLHNTDPRSAGMLVVAGQDLIGLQDSRMESVPGTAADQAKISQDDKLSKPDTDVFKMFLGAGAKTYKQHPSLHELTCESDCSNQIEDAYNAGKRIIWVKDGDLTISSNKSVGSETDPVVIIATGNVKLRGPMLLTGLLMAQGDLDWANDGGTSRITGAVVVGGAMKTEGTVDIVYRQSIPDQLRNRMGSFVRVPGSWFDPNT